MRKNEVLIIRISIKLKKELEQVSNKLDTSMSKFVRNAIIEKLNRIQGE